MNYAANNIDSYLNKEFISNAVKDINTSFSKKFTSSIKFL